MKITLNNEPVNLPDENMTVSDLLVWKHIPAGGTAVAVNNRLVRTDMRGSTMLNEGDSVTIISAAFGG